MIKLRRTSVINDHPFSPRTGDVEGVPGQNDALPIELYEEVSKYRRRFVQDTSHSTLATRMANCRMNPSINVERLQIGLLIGDQSSDRLPIWLPVLVSKSLSNLSYPNRTNYAEREKEFS